MEPKLAQRLLETSDGKELAQFLAAKIRALNSLTEIDSNDPVEISIEVKGRKRAIETLTNMLAPLVNAEDIHSGSNPSEYVV